MRCKYPMQIFIYSIPYEAVVSTRAFITSQSAEAHFILFSHIFDIAKSDTGLSVKFHHIDGSGIQFVVADGHKGQGLDEDNPNKVYYSADYLSGLGMFCVLLCATNIKLYRYEHSCQLCDLDPYDHLCWIYQLCIVHFQQNLLKLRNSVSQGVYTAMLSIACSEPHPDFENTLRII